jgi:hypothetical protein
MTQPVTVTTDLLNSLAKAQAECTIQVLTERYVQGYGSDDLFDDVDSALQLMSLLQSFEMDDDIEGLTDFLNTPAAESAKGDSSFYLSAFACDGVARAFYDLDCPALPKE